MHTFTWQHSIPSRKPHSQLKQPIPPIRWKPARFENRIKRLILRNFAELAEAVPIAIPPRTLGSPQVHGNTLNQTAHVTPITTQPTEIPTATQSIETSIIQSTCTPYAPVHWNTQTSQTIATPKQPLVIVNWNSKTPSPLKHPDHRLVPLVHKALLPLRLFSDCYSRLLWRFLY